jgi:hypothetical protein
MHSLSFFFLILKVSGVNLDEKTDCREEADFHSLHAASTPFPYHSEHSGCHLPLYNLYSWLTVIKQIMKRKET